jgi:hypothetical protein
VTALPSVTWTLDGIPIGLTNWECNSVANGGFDQMRGEASLSEWQRLPAPPGQGSIIRARQNSGNTVWYGRLSGPPQIRTGTVKLAAQGEKVRVEKASSDLLYQSRDYDLWVSGDSDPHNYDFEEPLGVVIGGGRIAFTLEGTQDINQGDQIAVVNWLQTPISRIAFTVDKGALAGGGYIMQVSTAVGPNGARTQRGSNITGTAPVNVDITTTSGDHDLLSIVVKRDGTGGQTAKTPKPWRVVKLRVNGITQSDSFAASDVVADVASRVGYDASGVIGTSANVLPLHWQQGAWTGLLDYMATLEDAWWRVVEPGPAGLEPVIEFDRWSAARTWTVRQGVGASVDLLPLELFNRALVRYPSVGGRHLSVTAAADPDPLLSAGITNVFDEFEIQDPQADDALASAVVALLRDRYSTQRYAGTIEAVSVEDNPIGGTVYDVRAGDLITVADYDANEPITLRAVDVACSPSGIRITPDSLTSFTALLAQAGRGGRGLVRV